MKISSYAFLFTLFIIMAIRLTSTLWSVPEELEPMEITEKTVNTVVSYMDVNWHWSTLALQLKSFLAEQKRKELNLDVHEASLLIQALANTKNDADFVLIDLLEVIEDTDAKLYQSISLELAAQK